MEISIEQAAEVRSEEGGTWWWAAASAQLALGLAAYRRGSGGSLMPVKAFGVASLFVGAGATALAGVVRVNGIHTVDDLKGMGASIRRGLGIPPRETA
ncbi:hypothetical protein H6P81_005110 [Aristolochia fimbriata]|uniref:Uncharacterized protein n=1 Tax=Aristolochia fimbriata TaxID=158543 RepID=A0AAV7EX29_ARIFI|nr:hypothetical protein H6P81_005110 [Aristolochia fimbriata]